VSLFPGAPVARGRWGCFLDTTEFFSSSAERTALGEVAQQAQALLFLPEVALTERAHQKLRRFKDAIQKLREFGQHYRLPPAPSDEALVAAFSEELTRESFGSVLVSPVRALSEEVVRGAVRLFAAAEVRLGFRDSMILLSSMQCAAEYGLTGAVLVSRNKKEFPGAIRALRAVDSATEWLYVPDVSILTNVLKTNKEIALSLVALLRESRDQIQAHVEKHRYQLVGALRGLSDNPATRESVVFETELVFGSPDVPATSDGPCRVRFEVQINAYPPDALILHERFMLTAHAWVTCRGGQVADLRDIETIGIASETGAPMRVTGM
jgi:hypothetical protein